MALFADLPAPTPALAGQEMLTTDFGNCYCSGSEWIPIPPSNLGSGIALTSPNATIAIAGSPGSTITQDVAPAYSTSLNMLPGVFTYATLPAAASFPDVYASTSDSGAVFSNGVAWQVLFNPVRGSLGILTASPLPPATNGSAYSQNMAVTGGSGSYTWSLVSTYGAANTITVSAAGVFAMASPSTNGTTYAVVQVQDSTGLIDQITLAVAIMASVTPAATPTFSPVAGTYVGTQNVTITCSTGSSTIYYTTNGSTPTTGSTSGASPLTITVAISETVKAIATAAAFTQSAVGSAAYTINASAAFNPPSPRIASCRFPGSSDYKGASYLNWIKPQALTAIGVNYAGDSINKFGGTGRGQWVDNAHTNTTVPGGCAVTQYIDPAQYNGTSPTPPAGGDAVHGVLYSHIDANNWLLRITGTSGTPATNGGFYVPNISTYVPVDGSGDQFGAFCAKWAFQCFKQGSGTYQTGFAAADAAAHIDGWYIDDDKYTWAGSIARDSTSDSFSVATNTNSSADVRANNWRAGEKKFFDQAEIDFPNYLRVSNLELAAHLRQFGTVTNSASILGAMNQVLDIAQIQFFFGWGYFEGITSFAQMVKLAQLYTNVCRPGVAAPWLDIAFLSGVGSTAFGNAGNGIPGSAPLTWTNDQPNTYTAAYVGMRYYTAFSQIVCNGFVSCDGFDAATNSNLLTFDEWGTFGSAGFPPGFAGSLTHGNSDPIPTAAKYGNGIWERRLFNPTTGKYGRWVMNPRGNGAQTYNPGRTLYKGRGTQNASYNDHSSFTTLAMASPDGGFFFEDPQ